VRYSQICILPGCDFNVEKDKKYFYEFFKKYKFRKPKIIGVVETLPNKDSNGNIIIGTGGRKDLFFYINEKDERRFNTWKYIYSICYYEDVFYNHEEEIYPIKFRKKYLPNL
jgi:hypothetical protein